MFKLLFGSKLFHTDEEFRKFLEARGRLMLSLALFGVVFIGVVFVAEEIFGVQFNEHVSSFYSGAGSGLLGAGLVLTLRNRRIMRNPQLLRKMRIRNSDERNLSIANSAFRWAAMLQFAAVCLLALFGMFIDPILTTIGMVLLYLFLFAYVISYFIISRKI